MAERTLLDWIDEVDLDATRADALRAFADDLLRFNRAQNLVSRQNPVEQVNAMSWEAFMVSRLIRRSELPSLDLGSGAGFPGIPLAILQPAQRIDLLERRGSRCEFLRRELSALGLENARVLEGDASEFGRDQMYAGAYCRVWLKAVAEPGSALELARPFLAPGGSAAIFRQENWQVGNDLVDSWRAYTRIGIAPEPSGRAREANALHVFHI